MWKNTKQITHNTILLKHAVMDTSWWKQVRKKNQQLRETRAIPQLWPTERYSIKIIYYPGPIESFYMTYGKERWTPTKPGLCAASSLLGQTVRLLVAKYCNSTLCSPEQGLYDPVLPRRWLLLKIWPYTLRIKQPHWRLKLLVWQHSSAVQNRNTTSSANNLIERI